MPPIDPGHEIAKVAASDAAALRRLGKTLRAALSKPPLRGVPGMEEVEERRVVAIRKALNDALAEIDALPRPSDHADDTLRGLGMTRADIAKALTISDGALKKRRTRRK